MERERGIRAGVRRFFRLALPRAELARADSDAEIEHHLAARTEQLIASGLSPDEARREAERRFGDVARARRALADRAAIATARGGVRDHVDAFGDDLRYTLRSLARSPAFTSSVILTFALGIGANAAMFGVIDRVLLRGPQHVTQASRVQRVYVTTRTSFEGERTHPALGYVSYAILRDQARTVERAAAYGGVSDVTVGDGAQGERARLSHATWDFFPLLGVRPALGRFFTPDEDRPPTGSRVVVLDHGFWKRKFGGDSSAIGSTVLLDGASYTVVGVAPPGFTGAELRRTDLWAPMSLVHPTDNWPNAWNAEWLSVIARLKPSVALVTASDEATQLHRRNYAPYPGITRDINRERLSLRPLSFDARGREPPEVAVTRWLGGVSLIVLLIATFNVGNLLLARAVRRRREVAIRLAVGIATGRLARLLVAESVILAFLGGLAGVALAYFGGTAIRALLLPDVWFDRSPADTRVLVFAFVVATIVGIVVGLLPLTQARRLDLTDTLKSGSMQVGHVRSRLRSSLLLGQAALSFVLLVGAGLFSRSLLRVRGIDLGFEPGRYVEAELSWRFRTGRTDAERAADRARVLAEYARITALLRRTPGVRAAATAVGTPFGYSFGVDLRVPGRDSIPSLPGGGPFVSAVSPDYFAATGTRLRSGRLFDDHDGSQSERVVIVNATMAETLWPGEDPLGKCLEIFSTPAPCSRVVGVVGDVHRRQFREPAAMQYYVPSGQESGIGGTVLAVRPDGDARRFMPVLRRILREQLPDVYAEVYVKQDVIDPLARSWRAGSVLFAIFGGVALVLAALGLYGVVEYLVAERTREFGVRLALGSSARQIVALVVSRGMLVTMVGLGAGAAMALAAGKFVEPLLFETSARDALAYAVAASVLLGVALIACVVPALRATRVDPVIALRAE